MAVRDNQAEGLQVQSEEKREEESSGNATGDGDSIVAPAPPSLLA